MWNTWTLFSGSTKQPTGGLLREEGILELRPEGWKGADRESSGTGNSNRGNPEWALNGQGLRMLFKNWERVPEWECGGQRGAGRQGPVVLCVLASVRRVEVVMKEMGWCWRDPIIFAVSKHSNNNNNNSMVGDIKGITDDCLGVIMVRCLNKKPLSVRGSYRTICGWNGVDFALIYYRKISRGRDKTGSEKW